MNDKNCAERNSRFENLKSEAGKMRQMPSRGALQNVPRKTTGLQTGDVVSTPKGAGVLKVSNPIMCVVRISGRNERILSGSIEKL